MPRLSPRSRSVDHGAARVVLDRVQAVAEFGIDGTVLAANRNFLDLLGFAPAEVVGCHHSALVCAEERQSAEYAALWERLREGACQRRRIRCVAKDGREVWIEGNYCPVCDRTGQPVKVIALVVAFAAQEAGRAAAVIDTAVAAFLGAATAIREISAGIAQARTAAADVSERVAAVSPATQRLADAAVAMGSIVGMIREIADQIDLLAVNATIEAERAGEFGRGYAVIAGEIASLASQAAHATKEIGVDIESVRAACGEVAEAQAGIRRTVDALRDGVAATEDAARTLQNASVAIGAISTNMAGPRKAAEEPTD